MGTQKDDKMTASTKSECLSRLDAYRVESVEAKVRALWQKQDVTLIAGYVGAISFVVTENQSDGQIEASVSTENGLATIGHVRALCKKMGIDMPNQVQRIRGGGLLWIARHGAT